MNKRRLAIIMAMVIVLSIAIANAATARGITTVYNDWYDITEARIGRSGPIDDTTLIKQAINTAGSKLIRLSERTYFVNDLTFPTDSRIFIEEGAMLSVSSGSTVTILGDLRAGEYQIFAGYGDVKIGLGSCDKILPQWWGAVVNDGVDDSYIILKAIAAAAEGAVLCFTSGEYTIENQIEITKPLEIMGEYGSVLDCSNSPTQPIYINGEVTFTTAMLESDANINDAYLTVTDTSGFEMDDWVRIYSKEYHNNGSTAIKAELHEISSISGNTINLRESLRDDYLTSHRAGIARTRMLSGIKMHGLRVLGRGIGTSDWSAILIANAVDVQVSGITIIDGYTAGLTLRDCVDTTVTGSSFESCNDTGKGYGVQISGASKWVSVSGCEMYDCRHGVSLGGNNGVQRDIEISNNSHSNSPVKKGFFGGHDTYNGVVISGNTISDDGLGYSSSINATFDGNEVYTSECTLGGLYIKSSAKGTEILNNTFTVIGNIPGINAKGYNSMIINNKIECSYRYGGIFLGYECSDSVVSGNKVISTGKNIAIRLATSGATGNIFNVTISDNIVYSDHKGIELDPIVHDLVGISITGNELEAGERAIYVEHDKTGIAYYIDITENIVTGCYTGILLKDTHAVNVSGNDMNSVYHNGIEFNNCSEIICVENVIQDAGTRGIWVRSNCSDYEISDNEFLNCTTDVLNQASY